MTRIGMTATVAAMAVLLLMSPAQAADKYTLDTGHTALVFKINHLGMSNTFGRFNDISGDFSVDSADPSKSSFQFQIKAASIDTGNEARDKHLRGPDFFSSRQHPVITFRSKSVSKVNSDGGAATQPAGEAYKVVGDLTLNGVTKSVTVPVKKLGEGKDPWGKYRIGFDTTFTIKRSDFGMNYGIEKGIVGDKVTLMMSFEGTR